MDSCAQRTGALAMNDPDAVDSMSQALAKIILKQTSDLPGLEGMKIELRSDLYLHRIIRWLRGHFRRGMVVAISSQRASMSRLPREGLPALANQ